jgi:Raf kinase inhibitor-like YbhB/YbcL family protein
MSASIMSRIGEQLRPLRHGLGSLVCNRPEFAGVLASIHLTSPAFEDHGALPERFTADGDGISPPLAWEGVPAEAAGLVLLVEDPDAPFPKPIVHAIAPTLPVGNGQLVEGELPNQRRSELADKMGRNSFAGRAWLPPTPPPGHGPHRYCFQLFALDIHPEFRDPPGRSALIRAMDGHVIAIGKLIATYERP